MAGTEQQEQPRTISTMLKTNLTIAFIAAGALYVWKHLSEFRGFDWPSITALVVVSAGFVASLFLRALYNYFAGRQLGANLTILESFMLSAVVTASNVVLPANPGAAFRAIYMKKVHAFGYANFAGAAALYFVITILLVSVISLGLLVLIHYKLDYLRPDLFVVLPAIAILAGLGLAPRRGPSRARRENPWTLFQTAYLDLIGRRAVLIVSIAIVVFNFAVASVVWLFVLRDQAPNLSVLEALLFAGSQIASGLINLTPGAAGFQEVIGIYVGKTFALSAVELFAILLWVRMIRTSAAVIIGIPCSILLRARMDRTNKADLPA